MTRSWKGPVALVSLALSCAFSLVLAGCGEEADYALDRHFDTETQADGRIKVTATVYCTGAGSDDCEKLSEPYCVHATWGEVAKSAEGEDDADAGAAAPGVDAGVDAAKTDEVLKSDEACATRAIKKIWNDNRVDTVVLSVTSLAPIPKDKEKTLRLSLDTKSGGYLDLVKYADRSETPIGTR